MESKYKIYMHKSPSGKVYIGQTKTSLKRRWDFGRGYKQCYVFYRAISKYGWDNIEHKLLFDGLSRLDAKMIEEDLIYYYKKMKQSYNIKDGETLTKEMIDKMSKTKKGQRVSISTEFKKGHTLNSIRVQQWDLQGNIVKEWDSMSEAARKLNGSTTTISACCKGKRKTHKGYIWKYV